MPAREVNIAIVGTGFIAETRARAYAGVTGYAPRLVAAVSRSLERAEAYARRHAIPDGYDDYERVLERADVEVADLCVPADVPRAEMLSVAADNAEAMLAATQRAGVRLMYGENWVYAPRRHSGGLCRLHVRR